MTTKRWNAVLAGLIGAGSVSLLMLLLRAIGLTRMNVELLLGSLMTRSFSTGSWLLGLVPVLVLGAVSGLLYGHYLERMHRSGWRIGLAFGALHAVVSGALLPFLGQVHPLVRDGILAPPGIFGSGSGWQGVVLFAVLHLVYGVLVASAYPVPVAKAPGATAVQRPPTKVVRSALLR